MQSQCSRLLNATVTEITGIQISLKWCSPALSLESDLRPPCHGIMPVHVNTVLGGGVQLKEPRNHKNRRWPH
jgi:hypothetical protein